LAGQKVFTDRLGTEAPPRIIKGTIVMIATTCGARKLTHP
jgi:hypothetical protein